MHREQHEEIGPNTSLLAKELQTQWHEKRNMHLGNSVIRPHSHRKVWWSCNQCPEGLPHVWEAIVYSRTLGRGCPFCSGRAVCQHNTLATKAPQIALFWDVKKNHPLSPYRVTIYSNMRVHWKCSACLHEWQAGVMHKTQEKSGCRQEKCWQDCRRHYAEAPYFCSGRPCLAGAMGTRQKQRQWKLS